FHKAPFVILERILRMNIETPQVITTPSTRFEQLKNLFLAGIYDGSGISSIYGEILDAATKGEMTETDEKHLRQIQVAFKRFSPGNEADLIIHKKLQKILRDRVRITSPVYTDYSTWKNKTPLAGWQTDLLFSHAVTLQITTGCSNYCRRCNEWALPKIRGHFTKEAVQHLLKELHARDNTDLALYGGSDPMDWADSTMTLPDLLKTLEFDHEYSLLTKIPKGKTAVVRQTVENGFPLSVSLTGRNLRRIRDLEDQLGHRLSKQHATADLLIPACLDEDFTSVKPSITDSYGTEIGIDGAFIVIPTFTSALYPFGHKKIPVTPDTPFFPVKKQGRPALLVDYFKPLEVADRHHRRYHLDHLLDVQVENILQDNGDYDLTPPGMRSMKEYFEVFDEKARQQRKKNTLSVMKRLKKDVQNKGGYRNLPSDEKTAYQDKINAHLDFTREAGVADARVSAASFFLAAIRDYLPTVADKHIIIEFLTKKEFADRTARAPELEGGNLATMFSNPGQSAWHLFRYLALSLVSDRHMEQVNQFISEWPAVYHPRYDRFVRSHGSK
ncbi:MAG: hypothetical protein MI802_04975, partial [Desulfobacterales bacterium]|nr:hypothetical protein [Desulfobacterales bacterium]